MSGWTDERIRHQLAGTGVKTKKSFDIKMTPLDVSANIRMPIRYEIPVLGKADNIDDMMKSIFYFFNTKDYRKSMALPLYIKLNRDNIFNTILITTLFVYRDKISKIRNADGHKVDLLWYVINSISTDDDIKEHLLKLYNLKGYTPKHIQMLDYIDKYRPITDKIYKKGGYEFLYPLIFDMDIWNSLYFLQKYSRYIKFPINDDIDDRELSVLLLSCLLQDDSTNSSMFLPDLTNYDYLNILEKIHALLTDDTYIEIKKSFKNLYNTQNLYVVNDRVTDKLTTLLNAKDIQKKLLKTGYATPSVLELLVYTDQDLPESIKDVVLLQVVSENLPITEITLIKRMVDRGKTLQTGVEDILYIKHALYDAVIGSTVKNKDYFIKQKEKIKGKIQNIDRYETLYHIFSNILNDRKELYHKLMTTDKEAMEKYIEEKYLSDVFDEDLKDIAKTLLGNSLVSLSKQYGEDRELLMAYFVNKYSDAETVIDTINSRKQEAMNKLQLMDEIGEADNEYADKISFDLFVRSAILDEIVKTPKFNNMNPEEKEWIHIYAMNMDISSKKPYILLKYFEQ